MSDSLQTSYMSSCDTLSCMKLVHADTFDRGSNKPSEKAFDKYWPANSIQDWTLIHACEALDFQKNQIDIGKYQHMASNSFEFFWWQTPRWVPLRGHCLFEQCEIFALWALASCSVQPCCAWERPLCCDWACKWNSWQNHRGAYFQRK